MRYSKSKKKCVKNSRRKTNRKQIRSKKLSQKGGGPLNSIMSMVPFMPKFSGGGNNANSSEMVNYEQQNNQNSQNVLVGALCNQFVKNNIKGDNNTAYDGVLDNLCSNQQVGLPARLNTNFTSNSIPGQNNVNNNLNNNQPPSNVASQNQTEEFQVPTFLSGVKGIAKMYSAPLRMGINAIKGYATKKGSVDEERQSKKSRKKGRSKKNKKKKKSKNRHSSESLEEQIKRAEKEILEERNDKTKIVESIKKGLGDNNNFEVSKVVKKNN